MVVEMVRQGISDSGMRVWLSSPLRCAHRGLRIGLRSILEMSAGFFTFQKFSEIRRQLYLEYLRQGRGLMKAAELVGVSRPLISEYGKCYPEFKLAEERAILEGRRNRISHVEDALYEKALEGNVTACLAWLYNRAPDLWRDMRSIRIQGVEDVIRFLPAELRQELRGYLTSIGPGFTQTIEAGEGEGGQGGGAEPESPNGLH